MPHGKTEAPLLVLLPSLVLGLVHLGFCQDSSPRFSAGRRYWVPVVSWACPGDSEASHRPDQALARIVSLWRPHNYPSSTVSPGLFEVGQGDRGGYRLHLPGPATDCCSVTHLDHVQVQQEK